MFNSSNKHASKFTFADLKQAYIDAKDYENSIKQKHAAAIGTTNESYYADKLREASSKVKTLADKIMAIKERRKATLEQKAMSHATVSAPATAAAAAKTESKTAAEHVDGQVAALSAVVVNEAEAIGQPAEQDAAGAAAAANAAAVLAEADAAAAAEANQSEAAEEAAEKAEVEAEDTEAEDTVSEGERERQDSAVVALAKARAARVESAKARKAKAESKAKKLSDTRITGDSVYLKDKKSAFTKMRIAMREKAAKVIESGLMRVNQLLHLVSDLVEDHPGLSELEIEHTVHTLYAANGRHIMAKGIANSSELRSSFWNTMDGQDDEQSSRLVLRASDSVIIKERRKIFRETNKALESGLMSSLKSYKELEHELSSDALHLPETEIKLSMGQQWYKRQLELAEDNINRKSLLVEFDKHLLAKAIKLRPYFEEYIPQEPKDEKERKAHDKAIVKFEQAAKEFILAANLNFVPYPEEVAEACASVAPVLDERERLYISQVICARFEAQVIDMRNKRYKTNDTTSMRKAIDRYTELSEERNYLISALNTVQNHTVSISRAIKELAKDGPIKGSSIPTAEDLLSRVTNKAEQDASTDTCDTDDPATSDNADLTAASTGAIETEVAAPIHEGVEPSSQRDEAGLQEPEQQDSDTYDDSDDEQEDSMNKKTREDDSDKIEEAAKYAPEGCQLSLSYGDTMIMGESYKYRRTKHHSAQNAPVQPQFTAETAAGSIALGSADDESKFGPIEDVFTSDHGCNIDTGVILHRTHDAAAAPVAEQSEERLMAQHESLGQASSFAGVNPSIAMAQESGSALGMCNFASR